MINFLTLARKLNFLTSNEVSTAYISNRYGEKFIAVACLITELWPFKVLKFQTAITPLLNDLER
jgi:hypothetical protein